MEENHDISIVGAGRWYRRDDQVGLIAAERLMAMGLEGTSVLATESPGTDIASMLGGVGLLILIDGAAPTDLHGPGSWQRIDYLAAPRRVRSRNRASSHTLSVDVALQMSAQLGEMPGEVWIYAIAVENVDYGEGLSPTVRSAMEEVLQAVVQDAVDWRRGRVQAALSGCAARTSSAESGLGSGS